MMNKGLSKLHPYPFERLAELKQGNKPPINKPAIDLSIGEPKHATPEFILGELTAQLNKTAVYPSTIGCDELRQCIVDWLVNRFRLPVQSLSANSNVLPVNGTREAIFSFAQCIIDNNEKIPVVVTPNPFYQIYEGAALLAGAEPVYANCEESNNFLPDIDSISSRIWERCQLLYLCSPGNPTGKIIDKDSIKQLLNLAEKYDFVIASDECYSEIYLDESNPPIGLLQAASELGNTDYERCIVFHSLSKRSNAPGLRSGFVAGNEKLIREYLRYRTYHGCAMPLYTQAASILAWQDEAHVINNRMLYREKFDAVMNILDPVMHLKAPEASFYLWPETPTADTDFVRGLYNSQNVTVLPGSYLSRSSGGINPGERRIRIALVAPLADCVEAAQRISEYVVH